MTLGNVWLRNRTGCLRYGLIGLIMVVQPIAFAVQVMAISTHITQLAFTTSSRPVYQNAPASFTVELRNTEGQSELLDSAGATLSLSSTSPTGQFAEADNAPWTATSTYDYLMGTATKQFWYRDATAGSYTITAKVTGGGLQASVAANQVVQVTGVSAPANGAPNSTYQNHASTDFSWDEVASATHYEVRMAQDSSTLENALSILTTTNSLHQANLTEGRWYWQVRALNGADISPWSVVWSFTIDTRSPVISTSIQDRQTVAGLQPLDMSIGDEVHPDSYDIQVKTTYGTMVTEGSQDADSSADFSFIWDTTQAVNGTYIVVFSATDAAQNKATPLERTVVVANAPPPPQTPAPTMSITGSDGITVSGLVSLPDATFTVTIDGIARPDAVPIIDTQPQNGQYAWTFTLPKDVQDGYLHKVDVTAHGNGQDSDMRELTVSTNLQTSVKMNDPLLEQLSASLSQPFTVPSSLSSITPVLPLTLKIQANERAADIHANPSSDQDVFVATPTESGWELFGVLWYWWGLAILGILVGGYMLRRNKYSYSTLDT